jgi:hypothetical protein
VAMAYCVFTAWNRMPLIRDNIILKCIMQRKAHRNFVVT